MENQRNTRMTEDKPLHGKESKVSLTVNMKEMLEAGVHYGHQCRRWNPKMKPYIFGEKNGICG